MEDFYWFEDPAGGEAEASGKIEVDGKTVNFSMRAYGACYVVNINGDEYPEFCGGPGDWSYRYSWAFHRAGDPEPVYEAFPQPSDPPVQIANRIEELRRAEAEPPEDPIVNIAKQVESPEGLSDEDEFVDTSFDVSLFHVLNGRKIEMPIETEPAGDESPAQAQRIVAREYIKELPVKREMPRPPLPKNMHRSEDAYITDPKTGMSRPNPDYKY